jgi:SAM-dependent methyltransferase
VNARDYYSQASQEYRAETLGGVRTVAALGRTERTEIVLDLVMRHVPRGALVADIGCGPAQYAGPLTSHTYRYIGIDLVAAMFADAARLAPSTARFVVGTADRSPLGDNSVDGAICIGVMEYTREPWKVLHELHRVLKPSGITVLSFPNVINPVHAVRQAARPVAGAVLRRLFPQLRRTVFVSGIPYRTFVPGRVTAKAEACGLSVVESAPHGFVPSPFNHRLSPGLESWYRRVEKVGRKQAPSLASDWILCLQKR